MSALVLFSGGSESVFTFLYVVVPVYGGGPASGRGAVVSCPGRGRLRRVLLVERRRLARQPVEPLPDAVLAMRWDGAHRGLVLVACLASVLVGGDRASGACTR